MNTPDPLTDEYLADIEDRADAATPGPPGTFTCEIPAGPATTSGSSLASSAGAVVADEAPEAEKLGTVSTNCSVSRSGPKTR
ncbi:hypothetical protein ACFV0O_28900 [Kitasatospora sp. NPDC059577]|uniref:hypothetical protein n=1 Tax=Kitasatospora sp. NPDC059577 TaxID=3346873 RepID=UPI00368506D6